jgi:hypothetical protein
MMVYVPSSGIWWGTYASGTSPSTSSKTAIQSSNIQPFSLHSSGVAVKGKAAAFINEQGGVLRQLDVLVFGLCGILAGSTAGTLLLCAS